MIITVSDHWFSIKLQTPDNIFSNIFHFDHIEETIDVSIHLWQFCFLTVESKDE